MNTFEIKKGYFTIWDGKTKYDYHVDHNHNYDNIEDPEFIYQFAINKGLTQEQTIDLILKYVHRKRIVKIGHLANISLCIALIGHRGSGKSVGATQIVVIDGLLALRKVVSNMPISLKVRYKDAEKVFETENLDAVTMLDFNDFENNYQDCWIIIDETNVDIADSYRSTSNQSLFFTHMLQQMRHRKLDFCFTTQSEMFLPSRARWQTDVFIKCSDLAMTSTLYPNEKDIGRKIRWQLYDFSGLLTSSLIKDDDKKVSELKPYATKVVWNTPFWNCYSTELMQRWDKLNLKTTGQKRNVNTSNFDAIADRFNIPIDLFMKSINFDGDKFQKHELWQKLDIVENITMQRRISKMYKSINVDTLKTALNRYFLFPSKIDILRNITNMSLEMQLEDFNV